MTPSSYTLPEAASAGFKDAAAYDAHRPSYRPTVVESLCQHLRIAGRDAASLLSPVNVVEVGSGTGKFTELLARRPEAFRIVAVEPHAEMRAQLAAKKLDGVKVVDGHAASVPIEDGWGDACVVAQAFHW